MTPLFDLQVNGGLGVSFTADDLTTAEIRRVADHLAQNQVPQFAPTVITAGWETLLRSFRALARACEEDVRLSAAMPIFHLEGPWISPKDGPRGAHPLRYIREPDWEDFRSLQDAAGGRIRLVTLAPERAGGLELIGKLCAAGIVVAIGHTDASPRQIRDAVVAGARLCTHLGNGCATMLPRHDNCLWEQLACDSLMASIIVDGHHLPSALVRTIVRAKGPDRVILISDASPLAGQPPGRYRLWDNIVEVEASGRIGVADSSLLAGSGACLSDCVLKVAEWAGVSESEAVAMASTNPRQLLL